MTAVEAACYGSLPLKTYTVMDFAVSLECSVFTGTSMGLNLKKTCFQGAFLVSTYWASLWSVTWAYTSRQVATLPFLCYQQFVKRLLGNRFFITAQKSQVADHLLGRKKSKGAYGMDRTETDWAPIAVAGWCTALWKKWPTLNTDSLT